MTTATLARVMDLLAEAEHWPDSRAREGAKEIVRGLLDLHGDALRRMLAITEEKAGPDAVLAMARDDLVSAVLLVHDAHPLPPKQRIEAAVARVDLSGVGGEASIIEASAERAWVRVLRVESGHRDAEKARALLEDAVLAAAPDVADVVVDVSDLSGEVVSVARLRASAQRPPGGSSPS